MLYPEERHHLHRAHLQMVRHGLTVWTSGNASMRLPGGMDVILIKPSGVPYEELTSNSYFVVGLKGEVIEKGVGLDKPSTDTASHLHIYRERPDVNAIVHTHSLYATTQGMIGPLHSHFTEMAELFGETVPVCPYATIGDDSIGMAFVSAMKLFPRARAVLLERHGVLTSGETLEEAVKRAVLLESIAEKHYILGARKNPNPMKKSDVDKNFNRYSANYGQKDVR